MPSTDPRPFNVFMSRDLPFRIEEELSRFQRPDAARARDELSATDHPEAELFAHRLYELKLSEPDKQELRYRVKPKSLEHSLVRAMQAVTAFSYEARTAYKQGKMTLSPERIARIYEFYRLAEQLEEQEPFVKRVKNRRERMMRGIRTVVSDALEREKKHAR